jgi:hypothetical protein
MISSEIEAAVSNIDIISKYQDTLRLIPSGDQNKENSEEIAVVKRRDRHCTFD